MNVYTVSFFGHREIEGAAEVERRLDLLLYDIISGHEYVEFLVGCDGEFDLMAASAVKRAALKTGTGNTSLVLVLPYMKADYRDNTDGYLSFYDEVEICADSCRAHYKAAIGIRNKSMIDRSQLVISYMRRKYGGAYEAVRYAKKRNVETINTGDSLIY